MSETYYAAVMLDVWMRGGNPDAVSRTRTEMCEANHAPADVVATLELQLQWARAQVARDMARLNVVSK